MAETPDLLTPKLFADYFNSLGAITSVLSQSIVTISLPRAKTVWYLRVIKGESIVLNNHDPVYHQAERFSQVQVELVDPQAFAKLIAHMELHSKFLLGGNNNTPRIRVTDSTNT